MATIDLKVVDPAIFENPPSRDRGNFILFSAHGRPGIEGYLRAFPRKQAVLHKAVSSTVLWSGVEGCNIPVDLFLGKGSIGLALNPYLTYVPQADVIAVGSGGRVQTEMPQPASVTAYDDYHMSLTTRAVKTRSAEKKGYMRHIFTINYAKYFPRRATGRPDHYAKAGSIITFAAYIWRKWHNPKRHKRGNEIAHYLRTNPMKLNEAITFQKGDVSPIVGLFITDGTNQADINTIMDILKNNPGLHLYLYSPKATEHIIRCIEDSEKIAKLLPTNPTFVQLHALAQPFRGFDPITDPEAIAEITAKEKSTAFKQAINWIKEFFSNIFKFFKPKQRKTQHVAVFNPKAAEDFLATLTLTDLTDRTPERAEQATELAVEAAARPRPSPV